MSCNCIKTVKTTAVVDLGTILVLVINPTTFKKRERLRLIVCQTIPAGDPLIDQQVVIYDGTNVFLVFDKLSEFIRRNNISCRQCYDAVVSNDPLHFQLYGVFDSCPRPNEVVAPVSTGVVEVTLETITAAIADIFNNITGGTE